MGQINTREIILFNGTAASTSTGPDINVIQGWQAAIIVVNVTSITGTLDLYIQNKIGQPVTADAPPGPPTGTGIYDDLCHFTQISATGTRVMRVLSMPNVPTANATTVTTADYAIAQSSLAAGALRVGPIGGIWRAAYTIGTGPCTFSVTAQLIPFST